jgi:hypothetical protein
MSLPRFVKILLMLSPVIFLILYFIFTNIQLPSNNSQNQTQENFLDNSSLISNNVSAQNNYTRASDPRDKMDLWYWSLPIHYTFSKINVCDDARKEGVHSAIELINHESNNTYFQEDPDLTNTSGEYHGIYISCFDYSNDNPRTELEGEGWPSSYYIGTREIYSAFINFYLPNREQYYYCVAYPDVEIHEILHTLGFDHIFNADSIMSPIGSGGCVNIDRSISNCLEYIYSNLSQNYSCQGIPFFSLNNNETIDANVGS